MHEHEILHLLRAIANTQREQGQLLSFIAGSLNDNAELLKLRDKLKAAHDVLQAAIDAVPPIPKP